MNAPRTVAPIVLIEDDANDVLFVRHALQHARIDNPLVVFTTASAARDLILRTSDTTTAPVLFLERLTEALQTLGQAVVTNMVSGRVGFRIIERR
jgi:hypothetical protein